VSSRPYVPLTSLLVSSRDVLTSVCLVVCERRTVGLLKKLWVDFHEELNKFWKVVWG